MATGRQVNIENYDVGRALGQASGKPGLILALALTFGVTLDKSPDFHELQCLPQMGDYDLYPSALSEML